MPFGGTEVRSRNVHARPLPERFHPRRVAGEYAPPRSWTSSDRRPPTFWIRTRAPLAARSRSAKLLPAGKSKTPRMPSLSSLPGERLPILTSFRVARGGVTKSCAPATLVHGSRASHPPSASWSGRPLSIGQIDAIPSQRSATSHGLPSSAGRQTAPGLPGGCVQATLTPSQTSAVQITSSGLHGVPLGACASAGHPGDAPLHCSARSHSPTAARHSTPALPAGRAAPEQWRRHRRGVHRGWRHQGR